MVGALASPAAALDVPPLTGRIVDNAHLLPADRTASLSAELAAHEARTGNQVAVLTLPSLEGEPLEEFSHRVATAWKLGRKGTDNGVLILVVPNDRKVRIEVGYGLEGALTDLKSSRIIREEIVPRFRNGDFPGGIAAGVKAVLGTIEGTYTPPERKPVSTGNKTESALGMLFLAVVVGILTAAIVGHHWKGGSIGSVMAFVLALSSGLILAIVAAVIVLIVAMGLAGMAGGGRSSPRGFSGWGGGSFGEFSSMRTLRSFGTTRMSTPLSVPFRPSFQAVATRWENSSSGSPSRDGRVRTATWLPVRASWVASSAESDAVRSAGRRWALSTMRPVSGGTSSAAAGEASAPTMTATSRETTRT